MKKILFIFILMFSCIFPFVVKENVFAESKYVKVIFTTAYVFSEAEALEENIIGEYNYGAKFEVLENVEESGYSFYKIKITDISNVSEAYILSSQVMDTSIFTPKKELDTNSTVSKDAIIYNLVGEEYIETENIIKANTKIRLISGYDSSVKYSKIQYVNEEGDIVTAYIKTSTIKVSHISRTMIGVIIIVVTSVSIILILFGIKKKRKSVIKKIFKK